MAKDRAHDVRRIPNYAPQPSPFPPMSLSNDVLGKVKTAASMRDEEREENNAKLVAKHGPDAAEAEAERTAAHKADKERNS